MTNKSESNFCSHYFEQHKPRQQDDRRHAIDFSPLRDLAASVDAVNVFEYLPVGFYVRDREEQFVFLNAACRKKLQLSLKRCRHIIKERDQTAMQRMVEQLGEYTETILRDDAGHPSLIAGVDVGQRGEAARGQLLADAVFECDNLFWAADFKTRKFKVLANDAILEPAITPATIETLDDLIDRLHIGDGAKLRELVDLCGKATLEEFQIDLRVESFQTGVMWLHVQAKLVRNRKGLPCKITGAMRDVTALRQPLENKKLGLQVLNAIENVLVFVKDRDLKFTYVNPALAKIIGLPPSEILGKTDLELFSNAAEVAKFNATDREVLNGHQQQILSGPLYLHPRVMIANETLTDRNGVQHELQTIKEPLVMPDGSVHLLGIATVVTKLSEAQRELAAERQIFTQLMEQVDDVICFKDCEGRFTRGNKAMARLAGVATCEELVGKTDYDFFAPDFADAARAEEQLIIATRQPVLNNVCSIATLLHQRDKRVKLISKFPMFDGAQRITGIVTIAKDITELPRIKQTIRVNPKTVEPIINSIPQAVFIKNAEGRYLSCNENFATRYGKKPVDFVKHTDFDLWPAEQAADRYRRDNIVTQSKLPRINVTENDYCDGQRVKVIGSWIPIVAVDGSVELIIGIFHESNQDDESSSCDLPDEFVIDPNLDDPISHTLTQVRKAVTHFGRFEPLSVRTTLPRKSNKQPPGKL